MTMIVHRVYKGHTIGEVHIASLAVEVDDDTNDPVQRFEGTMIIPFKNENLYAEVNKGDGHGPKVRYCGVAISITFLTVHIHR